MFAAVSSSTILTPNLFYLLGFSAIGVSAALFILLIFDSCTTCNLVELVELCFYRLNSCITYMEIYFPKLLLIVERVFRRLPTLLD
jgi:hypothetical protein